jgi:hypothetical protein
MSFNRFLQVGWFNSVIIHKTAPLKQRKKLFIVLLWLIE